ncbi:unnamed protein product [Ascophyllum nodosum]
MVWIRDVRLKVDIQPQQEVKGPDLPTLSTTDSSACAFDVIGRACLSWEICRRLNSANGRTALGGSPVEDINCPCSRLFANGCSEPPGGGCR